MRTTITLDPDVEALVKRLMRDRGLSFKEAVNAANRAVGFSSHPASFNDHVKSIAVFAKSYAPTTGGAQ